MVNYIFYDFETTGLSPEYDQVLQFAAIVTDENLEELPNSSIDIRCRLLPHIIPSPTALAVTNVSPSLLLNQDMSHREFMHKIEVWCAQWKPAIFLGYNSIGFDENMMRQGLYQSLHAPYLTNTSGNTRGDILRLVHSVYLFDREVINVPMTAKGKPTFKLGLFAKENGIAFDEAEAHDALYDVRKTIEVAQLLKNKAPVLWENMLHNTNKAAAIDFICTEDVFASGDVYFNKAYKWLATFCGANKNNPAQLGVFDLAHSPEDYFNLSVNELIDVLNQSPKVIRSLKANAQPFALTPDKASEDYWGDIPVAIELATERAQTIKNNTDFQLRVGEALAGRFEDQEASPNVEENIYGAFPSYSDKALMVDFHSASPEERNTLIDQFEDSRYKQIARRLVYFETPEVLPENIKANMDNWCAERLRNQNGEGKWRSISDARVELEALKDKLGEDDVLLKEIDAFLTDLEKA